MLRNENIPVVHQEHAYDDADVALTMALPWVHELGWPLGHCDPAAGPTVEASKFVHTRAAKLAITKTRWSVVIKFRS